MVEHPSEPLNNFHRTALFARISTLVACLVFYSACVVAIDWYLLKDWLTLHSTLHSLLALVMGGLLVFRTNTAYDRWWEGRKLWGQLVNDSRNLAIKIQTCVQADRSEKQLLARRLISFSFALKGHLRDDITLQQLDGFESDLEHPQHVPAYICSTIYTQLETWRRAELLGRIELLFLDTHAAALMNICGACERIRKTPISKSWRFFIRQILAIYLLSLPWGFAEDMGIWTIPLMLFVSYFMIGMESIAEDIEQPFGYGEDDLKLDEICESIRKSVLEIVKFDAEPSRVELAPTEIAST